MNYAEKQKAEAATVSPRTIKINLSDEDVKRLYEKAVGASITPEQLIENFIADLVCGTHTKLRFVLLLELIEVCGVYFTHSVTSVCLETLKEQLSNLTDLRRQYGNIRHKLEDIIVIGLCTVICGGEDFVDMEDFGKERKEFLRNFLELPNGIPDSDTFRRIFENIESEELSECLVNWLEVELPDRCVIAVDEKTICGSGNNKHKAYHVVSAFVAEAQITLGEITVEEKSNEITAVPELLDLLYIGNAIITADSMNCQKKIVQKICDGKADYCIALKENQPTLFMDSEDFFMNLQPNALIQLLPKKVMAELKFGNIFFPQILTGWNSRTIG